MEFLVQFVRNHGDFLALATIIALGYVAVYLLLQQSLERTVANLRGEWAEEISSLMITARLPRNEAIAPAPVATPQPAAIAAPSPAPVAVPPRKEEITPETLLVIAAAVTAFLGKKVRVRSAKMLYSHESFNAWSQQGRAVVQASHNVAQRVH
jgi:hypothetical protein